MDEGVSPMDDKEKHLDSIRRERDKALSLAAEKTAFLANMTHELRTPVHTINALTELLLKTGLDPEQKEYVRQLSFSGEVLGSLINDVLDLSKIESGKLVLEEIPFSPAETLEAAVDLVILQAHKKGLEVIVSIDPSLPEWLLGDPVRFRQIVVNLISNAVKFTEEGEIRLEMIFKGFDKDRRVLFEIHVVDTGIGIKEEVQAKLFQPYQQADTGTSRKFGGTGLGLMISRSLVEMMGGTLAVESREGEGSDFHFTLALSAAAEGSDSLMVSRVYEGKRVLLVDDNPRTLEVMAGYLSFWGFTVETLDNGLVALNTLRKQAAADGLPDIVFTDHMMPRMGGWQLASEIRSDENLKDLSMVLLSQTGRGVEEAKMKLLGWFAGYLNKPVKRSSLGKLLCDLLPEEGGYTRPLRHGISSEDDPEGDPGGAREFSSRGFAAKAKNFRILVAEDHPINQQLFETILKDWGFQVVLASNGWEAVEKTAAVHPDCLFIDLHMPRLDGLEATRRIRKSGGSMPIIAVTASDKEEDRILGREAGMSDYLTKPFRQEDLVPLLSRWLLGEGDGEEPEELEELEELEEPKEGAPSREAGSPPAESGAFSPRADQNSEIFDFSQAVKAFMGKADVVRRLVPAFRDKAAGQIREMEKALERGEEESLKALAHSIKGSASNLEARELAGGAAYFEECLEERGFSSPETRKAFEQLRESFHRFSRTVAKL